MSREDNFPHSHIDSLRPLLYQKKIFLTGGTGFFGCSVLDFLNQMNEAKQLDLQVTILSRDPDKFLNTSPIYKKLNWLKLVKGSVETFDFLDEQYDYILHFAAPTSADLNLKNPELMSNSILNGMKRTLEFAQHSKAKNFLFTSSGAAAEASTTTTNAYAEAKLAAEKMGCEFAKQNHFSFKIARCYAFVGPNLDKNGNFAIGNFIRDALNKNKIQIRGDGTAIRSYLFNEDLALWLLKILVHGKNNEIYNVGSDESITMLDLAKKIAGLLNPSAEIEILNTQTTSLSGQKYVPNIEKARNELGLNVWTQLDDAILASSNTPRFDSK